MSNQNTCEKKVDPFKMNRFWLLIILTSLLNLAKASIECHYCGLRALCPLPYKEEETERIPCAKSCMKFDGYSEVDNKRVLIRSCGEEDVNRCGKNSTWFGARGEMCLCNAANCNTASMSVSFSGYSIIGCILLKILLK